MESPKFYVFFHCISRDKRTNVWSVKCKKCNGFTQPLDTMFAHQLVECGNCGESEVINWNEMIDQYEISRTR